MGYERYPRSDNRGSDNQQANFYGRRDSSYTRDDGQSSARDYQATGTFDRDNDSGYGERGYGPREYAHEGYAQREQRGRYSRDDAGQQDFGRQSSQRHYVRDAGLQNENRDAYASQRGNRFQQQGYGRQPQGYDYEERGFFDRAGDEVRSWFGDDEASRRRDLDTRYDDRAAGGASYGRGGYNRDDDYHQWRRGQIDALDRDYNEYAQENRSKFDNEFGAWRSERQTHRGSLSQIAEHMEVVGSDGEHIGTVDKVRGDRILLTKNDADAGGKHHSIPSRWIETVSDKVTVRKTAGEAKSHWRDEERNSAFFNDDGSHRDEKQDGPHILNRSFSGTY